MSNPLDDVYNGLWSMVEAHPAASVIKTGNRIKFDVQDPFKQVVGAADVPELILVPSAGEFNLKSTSSSSMIKREWEWWISTGEQNITNINLVEWTLFVAHLRWCTVLTALKYKGLPYVKNCVLLASRTGVTDPERNRGIKGWSAVWRVQVEMHFTTSLLLDEILIAGAFSSGFRVVFS